MRSIAAIFSLLLVVTGFCFTAPVQTNPPGKKITIVFHNQVGNTELSLGDSVKISTGETITVERFRYYVSNFAVLDDKGVSQKLPVDYFLVDQENPSTKTLTLNVPEGKISRLSFLLGVDSIRNVSGIQTGALDPLKGMFWTWNSGYVMAKLEGSSESSNSAGNRFTYHIGGFRPGMNVLKTIELTIPSSEKEIQEIHINADIDHWFRGSTELKIAETPVCHSPGELAMKIANNYSSMFSINSIR
jgi:hypothetical protein